MGFPLFLFLFINVKWSFFCRCCCWGWSYSLISGWLNTSKVGLLPKGNSLTLPLHINLFVFCKLNFGSTIGNCIFKKNSIDIIHCTCIINIVETCKWKIINVNTSVVGQFIVSSLSMSGSCFVSGIFCSVGRVQAQRCRRRCLGPGRRTWTMCLGYRDSPRSWAHYGYSTVSGVCLLLFKWYMFRYIWGMFSRAS